MLKTKNILSKIIPQYIFDKAGKKLEEIEDIYFGSIAHKALQEETEYIAHADVKKKITQQK